MFEEILKWYDIPSTLLASIQMFGGYVYLYERKSLKKGHKISVNYLYNY